MPHKPDQLLEVFRLIEIIEGIRSFFKKKVRIKLADVDEVNMGKVGIYVTFEVELRNLKKANQQGNHNIL